MNGGEFQSWWSNKKEEKNKNLIGGVSGRWWRNKIEWKKRRISFQCY